MCSCSLFLTEIPERQNETSFSPYRLADERFTVPARLSNLLNAGQFPRTNITRVCGKKINTSSFSLFFSNKWIEKLHEMNKHECIFFHLMQVDKSLSVPFCSIIFFFVLYSFLSPFFVYSHHHLLLQFTQDINAFEATFWKPWPWLHDCYVYMMMLRKLALSPL